MKDQRIYFSASIFPYRSLSNKGFKILFASLAGLFFALGLGFFLRGAWPVIGFMGLELLALYIGFRVSYRQGKTREEVTVNREKTSLSRYTADGQKAESHSMRTAWARVEQPELEGEPEPLYLREHSQRIPFARDLTPDERTALAQAMRKGMQTAKRMS